MNKRIKVNRDWDVYEDLFPDNYRMYMYFAISLHLSASALNGLNLIWFNRRDLYHALNIQLHKHGWQKRSIGVYNWHGFRISRPTNWVTMAVSDWKGKMKHTKGDSFSFQFEDAHKNRFHFQWDESITITDYRGTVDVEMARFIREILKLIHA